MIAIVGAGITGLALAHELARRGVEFVVLEASGRAGGVIRSEVVDGHRLEWGPQRARLTGPMEALVRELGLEREVILAPPGLPLFVYADGRLRRVPFSVRDWFLGDLVGLPAKLRAMLEPLTGGPREQESVADYFVRKLGRQAYRRLLGPLYGGLYASDPADMVMGLSLGHVLREFGAGRSLALSLLKRGGAIRPPAACSFREGLATLPRALHARHRSSIRLSTPVVAVERTPAGYRLRLSGESIDARAVVLTVPAAAAARLLSAVAPEAADRVGTLRYNPLGVVHLNAGAGVPDGLGYQVAFGEALATRGVTFNHSLFGRQGVYTAYLGGAKRPDVVELDDDALGGLAVEEFARVTGVDARVLAVARERMPAWDRSWAAIQGMRLPEGVHLAANWESRPGLPGRLAQARRLATTLAEVR
jgi:protoporphyrinogen/coproporphyrinogen III oxidase